MQNICNLIFETACIFLIFLIATVCANINGMRNARERDGIYKTFEFTPT